MEKDNERSPSSKKSEGGTKRHRSNEDQEEEEEPQSMLSKMLSVQDNIYPVSTEQLGQQIMLVEAKSQDQLPVTPESKTCSIQP